MSAPDDFSASFQTFLMQQATQMAQMTQMVRAVVEQTHRKEHPKFLDERNFRRVDKFDAKESSWKEWRAHFVAAVKENNLRLAEWMMHAEANKDPITKEAMELADEDCLQLSAALYSRLLSLTSGPAFGLVESIPDHNGLEAWRALSKRYNPMTPLKCVQLMVQIVTAKINKNNEVESALARWEAAVNTLERDHKEKLSEKMLTALMVRTLPADLQNKVFEHMDRLTTYREVKEKVVSLVQSIPKYASDEMDCSWVGVPVPGDDVDLQSEDNEVNALGKGGSLCYRCGGQGHLAWQCATPKGAGKGKADGGKQGGKGFSAKSSSHGKSQKICENCGKTGHVKDECYSLHPDLLKKHREQRRRPTHGLDEETSPEADTRAVEIRYIEIAGLDAKNEFECQTCSAGTASTTANGGPHVCQSGQSLSTTSNGGPHGCQSGQSLAAEDRSDARDVGRVGRIPEIPLRMQSSRAGFAGEWGRASRASSHPHWQTMTTDDFEFEYKESSGRPAIFHAVEHDNKKEKNKQVQTRQQSKCPVKVCNMFKALAVTEEAEEVSNLDKKVAWPEVNGVDPRQQKTVRLKRAGRGKISVDSGAAENVMPKEMVPDEPLVPSEGSKNGTRYIAAGGQELKNYGEKNIKFKTADDTVGSMTFQATDVRKPLAAVSKIVSKGNLVVFGANGSYIKNIKTGKCIDLVEENGTYHIAVEYMAPADYGKVEDGSSGFAGQV